MMFIFVESVMKGWALTVSVKQDNTSNKVCKAILIFVKA